MSGLEGAFTELFLNFKIKSADKPLNLELPKIEEKIADFLCKIVDEDDKEAILHKKSAIDINLLSEIRQKVYYGNIL